MRNFPDNLPVSLLGLVMEPEATCRWKKKPQSQGCCSNPAGTGRRLLKAGTAVLAVYCHIAKDPSVFGRYFEGLFPNTFPPCFAPERSQFSWVMWCDDVRRCSKINASLSACPNPPLGLEQGGMRGLQKIPNDFYFRNGNIQK